MAGGVIRAWDRGGARLHDLALRAARFVRAAVPLDNQIDLLRPFADVVVARDFALDGAAVVERDDAFQPVLPDRAPTTDRPS